MMKNTRPLFAPSIPMRCASILLALAVGFASPAAASCFADYKAKQGRPLQLHYGVIELDDALCGKPRAAANAIADRIAVEGWTLLNVLSIFGPEGLEQRKDSAGQYFLRF